MVAYANPATLRPGTQRRVTIFGAGFLATGAAPSVVISGSGVAVSAVPLRSAERLRVTFTTAADATLGTRDVTVVRADGSSRTARAALVVTDARPPKLRGRVRSSSGPGVSDARVGDSRWTGSAGRAVNRCLDQKAKQAWNVAPGMVKPGRYVVQLSFSGTQ